MNIQAKCQEQAVRIEDITKQIQEVKDFRADNSVCQEVDKHIKELTRHERMIEAMSRSMDSLRRDRNTIQDKVADLQCRSMKMNLVFNGLAGESRDENAEDRLRYFLSRMLDIDYHIELSNVHRFGRYVRNKARPIVARFLYQRDLDLVRSRAYMLKGTAYGINQQFPSVIEERRKELYPIMRSFREDGNRVKLVRDRLYVNGQLYNPDGTESEACEIVNSEDRGEFTSKRWFECKMFAAFFTIMFLTYM